MRNLQEIRDFGANAAEYDALLERCFQEHPIFGKVLYDQHCLILGRKGSGKTAICKKIIRLQQSHNNILAVEYDFTHYPWEYHNLMAVSSAADTERYLHSWRYFILISLAKILFKSERSAIESKAYKKIKQFLIDTYGSLDPDLTRIFEPRRRIRGLKSLGVSIMSSGIEAEVDEVDMKSLPRMFQEVNSTLQDLMVEALNPECHYFICFDSLDMNFEPGSPDYENRLICLLRVARDFTYESLAAGRSLKVLVFLRSDIYDKLTFNDRNKITRSFALEVDWDKPYQDVTLKSLMERRFAEVLEIESEGAWEQIFDESVGMVAHPTKYAYILDHTFLRPRDIIEFCNCILKVYKFRVREKKGGKELNKFTSEDVYHARLEYSKYFHDEIVDEIHQQYPDYEVYFEMLRFIGYQFFSRAAFMEAYDAWKERLKSMKQVDEILQDLYDISVIGVTRDLTKGLSKARYDFKYMNSKVSFNRFYEHFSAHWGLTSFLDLKRDQPSAGFESLDPNITGSLNVEFLEKESGLPTTILATTGNGIIRVRWSVQGSTVTALAGDWRVNAYFESMGPGAQQELEVITVPVKSGGYSSIPYPSFSYQVDIPVSGHTASGHITAGVYKLTTSVSLILPDGTPAAIVGYNEHPLLQFYES